VLIPGAAAPKLVTREMLKCMKPGAVLVDVAIDQGGCFETSRPTTHDDPTYVVDEVVHYCVANMPGAVSRTSTYALNNVTLPHALRIADARLARGDAGRPASGAGPQRPCRPGDLSGGAQELGLRSAADRGSDRVGTFSGGRNPALTP
jgi:hypothetical protein